ncbi:hypothetical protein PFICI_10832 [Pestalotiopsis fici W106-1]|uniref:Pestheic acid cluster transcriptional regulator 1 n=1 Tax=Pestalotiopsis fici (strain W106-1 / CGMCC3.15140) TaxID=1229662 RepID=PTAR1_PESFW|nr:uncharacterized protein PFICI_10832 [Pestalotiopsis fici W106-1]A0A067XNJ0.1 RecName: Full=Pestheic acid cluster transcriptional regulator 1 [Pestalotiopsis fici W106-1]AGO59050.1 PtaR1 [Pestalotiopsis fici]ETS76958.1 hypothetical protein PFICI_10832 [Pestalotiopsis fici W106-1]
MSSVPIDSVQAAQQVVSTKIKDKSWIMPTDPAEFLQQIAYQSQLLACLHWLGEFQILACVPLSGSVPIKDVADLAGVPVSQLAHVIRFMATAGFMKEPRRGEVAHTPQSAAFVTDPSFLDAGIFLAQVSARSARKMAQNSAISTLMGGDGANNGSDFDNGELLKSTSESPRVQREVTAYLHYVVNEVSDTANLLAQLDWRKLGSSSVVEIRADRIYPASLVLTELHSTPRFTVQTFQEDSVEQGTAVTTTATTSSSFISKSSEEPSPKRIKPGITYQKRSLGSPQVVTDATMYVMRLERPHSTSVQRSILDEGQIVSELRAHLGVLKHNSNATLILIGPLLPEAGAIDAKAEMVVRFRDLSLNQLTSEREMEVGELVDIIGDVQDESGCLVVVNKLYSRTSSTVALEVRYELYNYRKG